MAPIISDCIQVSLTGTWVGSGRPWAVVQHCVPAGAPPAPEDTARFYAGAFISHLMPVVSAAVSLTGASYVDLSSLSAPSGPISGLTLPVVGGGSGTSCPPNSAFLIRMATIGSRSQRSGRMFLPGVDEDQVDSGGFLTVGLVGDMQDAIDDFFDQLTTDDVIPVVNSKASETTYEPATIIGMSIAGQVATQRRRLRR